MAIDNIPIDSVVDNPLAGGQWISGTSGDDTASFVISDFKGGTGIYAGAYNPDPGPFVIRFGHTNVVISTTASRLDWPFYYELVSFDAVSPATLQIDFYIADDLIDTLFINSASNEVIDSLPPDPLNDFHFTFSINQSQVNGIRMALRFEAGVSGDYAACFENDGGSGANGPQLTYATGGGSNYVNLERGIRGLMRGVAA